MKSIKIPYNIGDAVAVARITFTADAKEILDSIVVGRLHSLYVRVDEKGTEITYDVETDGILHVRYSASDEYVAPTVEELRDKIKDKFDIKD